jgi:hypothetical protein
MFEAFAANCFVLTNEMSGNIAEQVRTSGRGRVLGDESEVFDLLMDVDGVKETLFSHVSRNRSMGLSFNPQLIEESVEYMKPGSYFSYVKKEDLERLCERSSGWSRLVRSIELERIRVDYIENLLQDIQELERRLSERNKQPVNKHVRVKRRQELPPDHVEIPLHEMLDYLIEFLGRFPTLKRAGKVVFQVIWRVYQRSRIK